MTPYNAQPSPRPTIQLPSVVGMDLRDAETLIRTAIPGVRITVRHAHSAEPQGIVTTEVPIGCIYVLPGSPVTLTVSD
jgi:hypothetical protein